MVVDAVAASLRSVQGAAEATLRKAGVDNPRLDARLLMGHALGLDAAQLIGGSERRLRAVELARVAALVERRAEREPIPQILGRREFWSLPIMVTPAVLSPRPESETLVDAALEHVADVAAPRVLDLGTGSGCLLLAILSDCAAATGVGVDRSAAALTVARANSAALGLAGRTGFIASDWADALTGRFDVVVSNPPYVRRDAIAGLMPEVARFEPRVALDGGPDGLAAFRRLLPRLDDLLTPDGVALLEVDGRQAAVVAGLAVSVGLAVGDTRRDLSGVERCLMLRPGLRWQK